MEVGLGRFGDLRLEKGGPICLAGLSGRVKAGSMSAGWAADGLGKCGSRVFYAIVM